MGEFGYSLDGIDEIVGQINGIDVGDDGIILKYMVDTIPPGIENAIFTKVETLQVWQGVHVWRDGPGKVVIG